MTAATYDHTFFEHCIIELQCNPFDLPGLIAAVVCLIGFLWSTGKYRLLLTLPILAYTQDLFAEYFAGYLGQKNNLWFYNYTEIPLLIYTTLVFYVFHPNRKSKIFIGVISAIILVYHFGYIFIWGNIFLMDVEALIVAMIVLTVFIYMCLFVLVDKGEVQLLSSLLFWFLCASFVFYIGRVPITALTFGITEMSDERSDKMYGINDALMVFWYITTTVGVLISSKWMKKFI